MPHGYFPEMFENCTKLSKFDRFLEQNALGELHTCSKKVIKNNAESRKRIIDTCPLLTVLHRVVPLLLLGATVRCGDGMLSGSLRHVDTIRHILYPCAETTKTTLSECPRQTSPKSATWHARSDCTSRPHFPFGATPPLGVLSSFMFCTNPYRLSKVPQIWFFGSYRQCHWESSVLY